MTAYYEQDGIVIYHGDCLRVLDHLAPHYGERPFDLLLTDPPYGIDITKSNRLSVSRGFASDSAWDSQTEPERLWAARKLCRHQVVWGGNYYDLPPSRCVLVWDKANDGRDFADVEVAWTNFNTVARITRKRPMNMDGGKVHPTQKPEAVMLWALTQAPQDVRTVLDPFMGSGTTLVAAKRLGKSCVGIEREERYCEIAAKRLAQEALPLEMGA